ncbi:hypothetical protein DL96DRAFT_119715 [Flagelloscypha sp. PMI_526]|nr:hypothetical protein DL96DRAFT_119715 [Flagelloscypha sp. PMI_526]
MTAFPPVDINFFRTYFHYPSGKDIGFFGIINLVSLEWLEKTASETTCRSPWWDCSTLDFINGQSKVELARLEGLLNAVEDRELVLAKIGYPREYLLRSIAATQALLSLREAPSPFLPVELTCRIFRCAASQSIFEAKTISKVSQTVQKVVDPYIFRRIIALDKFKYATLLNLQTPRLIQAKTNLTAMTLLGEFDAVQLLDLWRNFPAVRSISFSGNHFDSLTRDVSMPLLRRLHINGWVVGKTPLSSQIFHSLTHLSILPGSSLDIYGEWDFQPLRKLPNLTHLLFHTHSDGYWYPNGAHAQSWTSFVAQSLLPSIPPSLRFMIWVAGEVTRRGSFEAYKPLWDGTMDTRLVLAFRKGDPTSDSWTTSQSAGAGSLAYVYTALSSFHSTTLDWLEWLWEDVERFVAERNDQLGTKVSDNL